MPNSFAGTPMTPGQENVPPPSWISMATVRKRNGAVVAFETERIERAIAKAFKAEHALASEQLLPMALNQQIREVVSDVHQQIELVSQSQSPINVEQIQDVVELALMRSGNYRVARRYIVYRSAHATRRVLSNAVTYSDEDANITNEITEPQAGTQPSDVKRILTEAINGACDLSVVDELTDEVFGSVYDGITSKELHRACILAARSRIERDPAFDFITARLMLMECYRDAFDLSDFTLSVSDLYGVQFRRNLEHGIRAGRIDPRLADFDLDVLAAALVPERDHQFRFLGLQALYDRYFIQVDEKRLEAPQTFWMRVAMGISLGDDQDRTSRAIEYYTVLSTFKFTCATPTLFNAGTTHPQLSSCYLSTINDELDHIFKCIGDNARLSKWAGGLGNDWTSIRATGAHINGTNGQSQGLVPFLKIVNDTAVAVNQGGKRKGAVCCYLECWHLDLEEFLDLRKNTGDDRRRTHDMHTANWIPDLFMQRVKRDADWTLFDPSEVPDLHDLYGEAFVIRYAEYEAQAAAGKITNFRTVDAKTLWRKMLTRLYETGHPWITWKDASNIRSPQDHVGVIHSSNLCTEILLNTSAEETAVCNLGSINLAAHVASDGLQIDKLRVTVTTAMRMLDNVIDINFYPTREAKNANMRHRPVGLGIMGFSDALISQGISYASEAAVNFADRSMEAISYYAICASAQLAKERGAYASYSGSKWDRGLLPIDTIDLLEDERGVTVDVEHASTMDWSVVRKSIARDGMRNSNVLAIAPTATISTIVGVSPSIEPPYKNLYVKSNLSGEFTQINHKLVDDLRAEGLWDADMVEQLKYFDGSLVEIERVPQRLKARYLTAFEIEPSWLIRAAARRQKWIDMGQSLNLYLKNPTGRMLSDMYFQAWESGLKTTYYLRTLAATQVEKSTVDVNRFGVQPRWMKSESASSTIQVSRDDAASCELGTDCEACQ